MGTLRDLKRGGSQSETGLDKSILFTRLLELVAEHGRAWGKIASIIEEEGFTAGGEVITANALRKAYTRWTESERAANPALARPRQPVESGPVSLPVPPVGSWQEVLFERPRSNQKRNGASETKVGDGGACPFRDFSIC